MQIKGNGTAAVDLPEGILFFQADQVVKLTLNGKVLGDFAYLRLVVLQESTLEVKAPHGVNWSVYPTRDIEPVDPTPHEALLSEPPPESMQDMIRRFIGEEYFRRRAAAEDLESFEESEDFDLDDDDDPLPPSLHELVEMQDEGTPPLDPPAEPPATAPEKPVEPSDPPATPEA